MPRQNQPYSRFGFGVQIPFSPPISLSISRLRREFTENEAGARDLRLRRARFTVHCAGIARFVFRRDLPRSESRQGQCGTNAEIAARFALDRIWPYRRKHCGIIAVEPRLTMLAELRSMRRLGFLFSELNRYLADIPGPQRHLHASRAVKMVHHIATPPMRARRTMVFVA